MAEIKIAHFRREFDVKRPKKEDIRSCTSSTFTGNMREQPKATKLVYSPRRPAKTVGKSDENSKSLKQIKTKSDDSSSSSLSVFEGHEKRKSLQILQPSADGQKLLVGGKNSRRTKAKSKTLKRSTLSSTQKQLKHYLTKSAEDVDDTQSSSSDPESNTTSVTVEKSDAPTSSDEAYALMVQERAPEKYWELVAEERRKALEETLNENMKLYEMIETLKAENEALKEKANNTDYFATMYKITKDDVPAPTQVTSDDS